MAAYVFINIYKHSNLKVDKKDNQWLVSTEVKEERKEYQSLHSSEHLPGLMFYWVFSSNHCRNLLLFVWQLQDSLTKPLIMGDND